MTACTAYTKSSVTLCSPEGSDLYSTTPSTSTMRDPCQEHACIRLLDRIALTSRNSLFPRNHISTLRRVSATTAPCYEIRANTYPALISKRMTKRAAIPGGDSMAEREISTAEGFLGLSDAMRRRRAPGRHLRSGDHGSLRRSEELGVE